jgi:hypothetical protein
LARTKSIEQRLATLERRAAPSRASTLETSELRLVDKSGRLRALLDITRAGPRLAMMREDGTTVLELMVTGDGAGVRMTDAAGNTRVFVGATRGTARLGMSDGDGANRLFLGLSGGGDPALTLYDGSQREVWATRSKESRVRDPKNPRATRTRK